MPKKPGKIGGKKVGGVKPTTESESVSGVAPVGGTSKASGISKSGSAGKRRLTRTMTYQEREKLFGMIHEEAEKLFQDSALSHEQRKVIEDAVKIAVDSGLVEDEEKEEKEEKK